MVAAAGVRSASRTENLHSTSHLARMTRSLLYISWCLSMVFVAIQLNNTGKDTRCADEKGIEEISSILFEELHVHFIPRADNGHYFLLEICNLQYIFYAVALEGGSIAFEERDSIE